MSLALIAWRRIPLIDYRAFAVAAAGVGKQFCNLGVYPACRLFFEDAWRSQKLCSGENKKNCTTLGILKTRK